ncbi:MAG: HAMP domain-containing protein, partial [Chloroflexi bacterium]|nr:HAMP domain-containing protein [Chloroflexota bacterium]
MPLRLRLTLLSTALVGVTLLVFGLFVYFMLARTLTAEVDGALIDRARVIRSSVNVSAPSPGVISVELPGVDAVAVGGALVQVVNREGTVRARSETLGHLVLPVSSEARAAALKRRGYFELVQLDGADFRLYSSPLILAGEPIGVLQVARPIGPTEQTLALLRLVLLAGGAASIVVCALIGLLVARAALRPIDRLTREAEQIGASQDFGSRVITGATAPKVRRRWLRPAADEVGRLAATFNSMLDRLQTAYAALQNANKRLEATLESQRRFIADASHELRTPLTTVRGNAALLRRFDALTPEDRLAAVDQ